VTTEEHLSRRDEILLKEYETCQSNNNSLETQVWTSTTIFMSFNVTLLSGLIYLILTNNISVPEENQQILYPFLLLVFIGIITILFLWINWLKRVKLMRYINNSRMRLIEHELNMWKNRMVPIVDGSIIKESVPDDVSKEIGNAILIGKTVPGTKCLIGIVTSTLTLWFIVFIMGTISFFY
jgi:hypothetical protein